VKLAFVTYGTQDLIEESRAWKSGVTDALKSENVSLKKVEQFIAEGEKLPFHFDQV
jgi:hypothetical protein